MKIDMLLDANQMQLQREDFSALLPRREALEGGDVEEACEEVRRLERLRAHEAKLQETQ